MATLCVNIDHVATVRQARGGREPDPVLAAMQVELAGSTGVTVHLREDRRHIQDRDLRLIREVVRGHLNLEMAATEEMVRIAIETGPRIATIVPERREELTTEGGLDAAAGGRKLKAAIAALREAEIEVSLFVDPDARQIEATLKAGADAVEIHTGAYANARDESEVQLRLMEIAAAAELADGMDLRVHAGHGLNYANVSAVAALAHLRELNIGHSIVSRAVFDGLPKAVADMARLIREASGRGAPPPSS